MRDVGSRCCPVSTHQGSRIFPSKSTGCSVSSSVSASLCFAPAQTFIFVFLFCFFWGVLSNLAFHLKKAQNTTGPIGLLSGERGGIYSSHGLVVTNAESHRELLFWVLNISSLDDWYQLVLLVAKKSNFGPLWLQQTECWSVHLQGLMLTFSCNYYYLKPSYFHDDIQTLLPITSLTALQCVLSGHIVLALIKVGWKSQVGILGLFVFFCACITATNRSFSIMCMNFLCREILPWDMIRSDLIWLARQQEKALDASC